MGQHGIVAAHNFSAEPRTLRVKVGSPPERTQLVDLLDNGGVANLEDGVLELQLAGYGYRWFRLQDPDQRTAP